MAFKSVCACSGGSGASSPSATGAFAIKCSQPYITHANATFRNLFEFSSCNFWAKNRRVLRCGVPQLNGKIIKFRSAPRIVFTLCKNKKIVRHAHAANCSVVVDVNFVTLFYTNSIAVFS